MTDGQVRIWTRMWDASILKFLSMNSLQAVPDTLHCNPQRDILRPPRRKCVHIQGVSRL